MRTYSQEVLATDPLVPRYYQGDPGGDEPQCGTTILMHTRNNSDADVTATIVTPNTVQGLAIEDFVVTIPARSDLVVRLDPSLFRDSATGLAHVSWSDPDNVEYCLVRV